MRKFIVIVTVMLCLCFVGCGGADEKDPGDGTGSVSAEISVPAEAVPSEKIEQTESEDATMTDEKGNVIVLPDQTFATESSGIVKDTEETSDAVTVADTTERSENVTENTTAVTTVTEPLVKPLPNGGIELPDDIW